jgi:hypothetical protein
MLDSGKFGNLPEKSFSCQNSKLQKDAYMNAGICIYRKANDSLAILFVLDNRDDETALNFVGGRRDPKGKPK